MDVYDVESNNEKKKNTEENRPVKAHDVPLMFVISDYKFIDVLWQWHNINFELIEVRAPETPYLI